MSTMLFCLAVISLVVANSWAICPDGYSLYGQGGSCLRASTDKKTFQDARKACGLEGGDLVQVKDRTKASFVLRLQKNMYWMGAWDETKQRKFTYLDGNRVERYNFKPWKIREPNNAAGNEYCIGVYPSQSRFNGQWNDLPCTITNYYVCEIKVCQDGYSFYKEDNTCLKAYYKSETRKIFSEARKVCQKDGGDLVTLRDQYKPAFIESLIVYSYWIGAWDDDDKDRKFTYLDGTPLGKYNPWKSGEPNNALGREYCAMVGGRVRSFKRQWYDNDCASYQRYVCEKKVNPCQNGYSMYSAEGKCIKTYRLLKNFNDARSYCKSEGGDLVQTRDAAKATFIGKLFGATYWMGVWDTDKDRQFSYVDGTPTTSSYRPWRRGEPNNAGRSGEYCVSIIGSGHPDRGQWNDANCWSRKPFVCEVKMMNKLIELTPGP